MQVFHLIGSRLKFFTGTVPFHFNADSCKHLNHVQVKAFDKKSIRMAKICTDSCKQCYCNGICMVPCKRLAQVKKFVRNSVNGVLD